MAKSDNIPIIQAPEWAIEWGRRILHTSTGAKRLSNRKRVIRRRRQGRVTTVVFFTAAQPGPIVPVRAVDNQATNACPPDADAVTGDGIARSSGGHAE